jgi:HTH-type transcriptional repressor of NAD biosynthesis genes
MDRPDARYGRGVVIGKFYPPHRGHKLLIDTAQSRCRHVTVIVCAKPTDVIPGQLRAGWLAEIHPAAEVMLIDDRYDENDSAVWAANTIRWLGSPPDVVFTSESYGEAYARHLGCDHILVDATRQNVPCSGTMIRRDPYLHWEFLEPPVRAWFCKRVCIVGAESTGTTTLAQDLAEHYLTVWVPEYGRDYSAEKQLRGESTWSSDEFVHIARRQNELEAEAARRANRLVVGDTNSFATVLWHRRYLETDSAEVAAVAAEAPCDLYLLTGDEIPFVQDGLRDGEHVRHEMHKWFAAALVRQTVPWQLVRGSPAARLALATSAVEALFADSQWLKKSCSSDS